MAKRKAMEILVDMLASFSSQGTFDKLKTDCCYSNGLKQELLFLRGGFFFSLGDLKMNRSH